MKPGVPYFAHDINARRDPKLLRLRSRTGFAAVGVFWSFLELLHDVGGAVAETDLDVYAIEFAPYSPDEFADLIRTMLDLDLLVRDGRGRITHPRVLDTISRRERLSTAGRAGARNRWSSKPPESPPESPPERRGDGDAIGDAIGDANADKIRGEEIRQDEREDVATSSETDESRPTRASRSKPSTPSGILFPVVGRDVDSFDVPTELITDLSTAFPSVDVVAEIRKAVVWCAANPSRRKTPRGIPRFLFTWIERASNSGRASTSISKGYNDANSPNPRDLGTLVDQDAARRERWGLDREPRR